MTFSITARCSKTGMFGVAVTSSSPAVASRCAWARPGVGAVATQNITDPMLGARLLDLMEEGREAPAALDFVVSTSPNIDYRQLTVIDAEGRTAHFSGDKTLGRHAVMQGKDCIAAGNLLSDLEVPAAMTAAFEAAADAEFGERLMRALEAGEGRGGEEGPVKSAGLLAVAADLRWAPLNLRQDWVEEDAIAALRAAWEAYRPQMADYVTRASNPAAAPSYGVPGDL